MSPHASANIARINDAGSINIVNRAIICRTLTRDEIAGKLFDNDFCLFHIALFNARHNADVRFNIPISGESYYGSPQSFRAHFMRVFHA